jgi:hypothetical protein
MSDLFAPVWRDSLRVGPPEPINTDACRVLLHFLLFYPQYLLSRCLSLFADDTNRQLAPPTTFSTLEI